MADQEADCPNCDTTVDAPLFERENQDGIVLEQFYMCPECAHEWSDLTEVGESLE